MLDADAEPHERLGHGERLRGLPATTLGKGFDATEAGRRGDEAKRFNEAFCSRRSPGELDRYHGAEAAHLSRCEPAPRVGRQARVAHPRELCAFCEPRGQLGGRLLCAIEPHGEGAQAAKRKPGLERARNRTLQRALRKQPLAQRDI